MRKPDIAELTKWLAASINMTDGVAPVAIILFFVTAVACSDYKSNIIDDYYGPNIVSYTAETFPVELPQKNHFVMFFRGSSDLCKRVALTFDDLAKKYKEDKNSNVVIAKVDCFAQTSVCANQRINGFPMLKFFKEGGEKEGIVFNGNRDLDSLDSFVKQQLHGPLEEDMPKSPEPKFGLGELTDQTFQKTIEKGSHFIKFYTPWCELCERLAPTWEALARTFEHDKTVNIGKVDCTAYKNLCTQFEVRGHLTLLWIKDGQKKEHYTGSLEQEDLKRYVSDMKSQEDPSASSEGEKVPDAKPGDVMVLKARNFDAAVADGTAFVKFYAPWSGHCRALAPTWTSLAEKFSTSPKVTIAKVDCTVEEELCQRLEVTGYTTLFLFKNGIKLYDYYGERDLNSLYHFVVQHVSHDEL